MTIWVADTSLLLPSSSRRLLLGVAAIRGESIGITPIAFARNIAGVRLGRPARSTEASLHQATELGR